MASGGDRRRIHDRRPRERSESPGGGAAATPQSGRSSTAEVAGSSARGKMAISREVRNSPAEVAQASIREKGARHRRSVSPGHGHGWIPISKEGHAPDLSAWQPQAKAVHPQLSVLLSRALARMTRATYMDNRVFDEFLHQISEALLGAEFSPEMVSELQSKVKSSIDIAASGSLYILQKAITKQLCRLVDSGVKPGFVPKKGKPCVVLVVGLPGSGMTSSCAKFAFYHQMKGHNPAIVCADTRGEHAFYQVEQIAREANILFHGSCTETNPVKIVIQGVERLKKESSDLIIIDASGCHTSDAAYLSEICKINKATKPDLIVLVVDAGGGRSAFSQSQIFTRKVSVGSVIVTRMDDRSNGGGTLNALAAARLPVILLGTGKQIQEFEVFNVKLFAKQLLNHKARSITVDTEDMHRIFDNLNLSKSERKSAMDDIEKECCNAYNAVLEKYKLLVQQICKLESKYKKFSDVLGEKGMKSTDIQSATTLEERHSLMLTSVKFLEKEINSRTKKLQILLSKGLALLDFLGLTNSEQRSYKYKLENLSTFVQEVDSLSMKSLEKFETRVKELELKKAEQAEESKHHILRQSQRYIRGETEDMGGLKDLIQMVLAWELKYEEVLFNQEEKLLSQLRRKKAGKQQKTHSPLNSDISGSKSDTQTRHSNSPSGTRHSSSDTQMENMSSSSGTGHSSSSSTSSGMGQSSSSSTSSGMGQSSSSSSSGRSSDPDYMPESDPDFMPESMDSDDDMGEMASESPGSLGR